MKYVGVYYIDVFAFVLLSICLIFKLIKPKTTYHLETRRYNKKLHLYSCIEYTISLNFRIISLSGFQT